MGYIDGFVQLIPGSHRSDTLSNITSVDKVHLNCDCINGSTVNGVKEPFLFRFALDKLAGFKIYTEPRIKLLKN